MKLIAGLLLAFVLIAVLMAGVAAVSSTDSGSVGVAAITVSREKDPVEQGLYAVAFAIIIHAALTSVMNERCDCRKGVEK